MIRALLRDGAVYAGASIVSRGLALLLLPLYTRLLAPAEYGSLDLIVTLGVLVNLVFALEVAQGLARLWSDAGTPAARRRLASTALMFTVAGHAAFLLLGLVAAEPLTRWLFGDARFEPALRAGMVFVATNGVFLLLQNQFRWELRPRGFAGVSLLYAALTVLLGAGTAYALDAGLPGILWGQAAAAALCALFAGTLLRGSFAFELDRNTLRAMLAFSLPLVPASASVFAILYANRLMLAALGSLDEVGVFGAGHRIASLVTLLIVGLQGALTPLVYAHHAEPETPVQLARLFDGFVAVALPVCLLSGLFATELVAWLATPAYAAGAALVIWLAPAALLTQMYIFAPGIAIAKKTQWQLLLSVASALVGVALNALLIGPLGAQGAAVATLVAAVVFFGAWLAISQRLYRLPLRAAPLSAATLAFVLLALAGSELPLKGAASIAVRSACVVTLLVAIMAVGLVRRGDLARLVVLGRPGVGG